MLIARKIDDIIFNVTAFTKWVFTKYNTAFVSSRMKSMINLKSAKPHHACGQTSAARNAEIIFRKLMAAVEANSFTTRNYIIINSSTGQHAEPEVENQLTNDQKIRADQKKTTIVRIKKS